MTDAQIGGVLLAAGASRRMGQLKQLLPFGDRTVLEQGVVNFRLAGIQRVIVVLGFAAEWIQTALPELFADPDIVPVFNERHEDGMLTSVQCGIQAASEFAGVVLGLVDQPFIPPSVIQAVVETFRATEKPLVIPQYGEQRGHPIAISMAFREAILALGGETVGLRDFLRAHRDETHFLPLTSDEVLRDMDIPQDYRREVERWMQSHPKTDWNY